MVRGAKLPVISSEPLRSDIALRVNNTVLQTGKLFTE